MLQKWSSNARYKLLSMCINLPLVALATAEKVLQVVLSLSSSQNLKAVVVLLTCITVCP